MQLRASLIALGVWTVAGCNSGGGDKPDAASTDAAFSDGSDGDHDAAIDGPDALPALGVYTVNTDGTGLRLLVDAGTQHLSHVRQLAGTDWLTATRYTEDPDNNGLAMEVEANAPGGLNYGGAQIVVFRASSPTTVTAITPVVAGKMTANSSWTSDGKLIFLRQDHPSDPNWTRLERATFTALPGTFTIDAIPLPPELILPIDPHQSGASDASGSIVFPALFHHPSGWMRPVWKLPANGATSLADASVVGCPICPEMSGCCAWPTVAEVLGTNDPRFDHAGTRVTWMQQHPDVSFDLGALHGNPMRPQSRVLASPASVDLTPPGVAATTSVSFGEWRHDDAEVVYWTLALAGTALQQHLFRMAPDGTQRQAIPLPPELCPHHPSYLSSTQIVFSAFRCFGASCTCAP